MPITKEFGEAAASTAGSGLVGSIFGLLAGNAADNRQLRQQRRLNEEVNKPYQKWLYDLQMQKELEMWEKTGYGAQKKQMLEAGINPALMYGMSGGGGQTVGGGAGAGVAAHAATGGGEEIQGMGLGLQAAMQQAQIDVMKSQADLNKASAESKRGTETEESKARTESIYQGIANAKIEGRLKEIQANILSIEETLKKETYTEAVDEIIANSARAKTLLDREEQAYNLDRATYKANVDILIQQSVNAITQGALLKAQVNKTSAELQEIKQKIKSMAEQTAQGWADLDIKEKQTRIQQFTAELNANFPSIMNVIGGKVNGALEEWSRILTGHETRTYTVPKK